MLLARVFALLVAVLLAPASVAEERFYPARQPLRDVQILCGENVSSATVYGGPSNRIVGNGGAWVIASSNCDTVGSGTEATADEPIGQVVGHPAVYVLGMICFVSSNPTNDIVITARTAAGDMSPTQVCTVVGSGPSQSCTVSAGRSPVAAGATVAVKVVTTEDLSLQDFWCKMYIEMRP